MQSDRIKLLKRIRNLPTRRIQPRIQRDTLHLTSRQLPTLILPRDGRGGGGGETQIDRRRLLDVTEIDRVDAPALVGDDGGLLVAEKGPRGVAEEGVGFDV